MKWIDTVIEYLKNFSTYFPTMDIGDIAEILIIALLLYYLMVYKNVHIHNQFLSQSPLFNFIVVVIG